MFCCDNDGRSVSDTTPRLRRGWARGGVSPRIEQAFFFFFFLALAYTTFSTRGDSRDCGIRVVLPYPLYSPLHSTGLEIGADGNIGYDTLLEGLMLRCALLQWCEWCACVRDTLCAHHSLVYATHSRPPETANEGNGWLAGCCGGVGGACMMWLDIRDSIGLKSGVFTNC